MANEKLFQVGVKALITNNDDKILVLDSGDWHMKNQVRHWDIPGGRIQEGHSVLETLKRKLASKKYLHMTFLQLSFLILKTYQLMGIWWGYY